MDIKETKNKKKINNWLKIIAIATGGIIAGMTLCIVGVVAALRMADTAANKAFEIALDPFPRTAEERLKDRQKLEAETKATVTSSFIYDIPITESEFIPEGGEYLLVISSITEKAEFYLVPLDKSEGDPKLIQWDISVEKTAEDRHLSVQQIQSSSKYQLIIFEDGSYTADEREGSKNDIVYSDSDSLKAKLISNGEIVISTGTNFEELVAQIDQVNATALTWSIDDKYLYFIDSQSTTEKPKRLNEKAHQHTIYRVNLDGSELTKIYKFPYPHPERFDPEIVSIPGREELIINVFEDLIILNPTTGQVSASPSEKLRYDILVSPDGSKIAYKSPGRGVEAMQIQSNRSMEFKMLSRMPGSNRKIIRSDFKWTTDSQHIVYQYNEREEGCYWEDSKIKECFNKIAVVNAETGELNFPLDNYAFEGRILGSISR